MICETVAVWVFGIHKPMRGMVANTARVFQFESSLNKSSQNRIQYIQNGPQHMEIWMHEYESVETKQETYKW